MKNWLSTLTSGDISWKDILLNFGGLLIGGATVYFGLFSKEVNWKLLGLGGFILLVSLILLPGAVCQIARWIRAMRAPITSNSLPCALSADRLCARLRQIQQMVADVSAEVSAEEGELVTIDVSEKRALWIDDITLDAHLLKQSWCAAVSLPCGGTLLPLQLRRIAEKTPVKLPKRFLSSDLTSCILCWEKGQLTVFPETASSTLVNKLTPGLLSEPDADFETWLADYRFRLTEEA